MASSPVVLICNRFHPEVLLRAKANPNLTFEAHDVWKARGESPDAVQGLIIRSGTTVNEKWLARFPKLRVLQTATSGFDHIDLKLCKKSDVAVAHVPEAPVQAVAELTFLLLLGLLRKQKRVFQQMRAGSWDRAPLVGQELRGKSLGLVGCGRIGGRVAQMAKAWGLQVMVFDPHLEEAPEGVSLVGFEELLHSADILSFHVPKTPKTRFMLQASTLDMLASNVIILNTSRGGVINEDHLLAFLKENPGAMAGLDVFEKEPLAKDSPLHSLPNVLLSPHVGASTEECLYSSSLQAYENILKFFADGQICDQLPPRTLWWQDVEPNEL